MKTLFTTLSTRGKALPTECWPSCVWEVLLPVWEGVQAEAVKVSLSLCVYVDSTDLASNGPA